MVTLAGIVSALADCLEALKEGSDELEARLRKHEKYRQELVALLGLVEELETVGQGEELRPSDEFVEDLKAKLVRERPTTHQRGGDQG